MPGAAFVGILAALASAIGGSPATMFPSTIPPDPATLQADLNLGQRVIDDPGASTSSATAAGQFEQLATETLAHAPPSVQRAIVSGLAPAAASTMRANLDAAGALSRLVTRRRSLPPWRIEQPPAPAALLDYFKGAQGRSRVPWEYLAAIEFVETKFGRVNGLSTAGAEGPMQFMPATWAIYGRGDVHDPRDAIFGAARYLAANGAPRDMAGALLHYNPSMDYVRSVTDYAMRMRSDPRAYYGYYAWQVLYAWRGGTVILPVGYPKVRPQLSDARWPPPGPHPR